MISSLELAKLCGVSQGTVDRALHGRPGISAVTRERILAAAAAHGYAPHPAARELMGRSSTLVGAVAPASGGVFFLDLLNAVRSALLEEGLRLWIGMYGDEEEFLATAREFAARRCLGVVLIPPRDRQPLPAMLLGDTPGVSLIARCEADAAHAVPLIAPDETTTGWQAAEYLWGKGHRRILHLTYHRDSLAILDRARGYEAALRKRGGKALILRSSDPGEILQAVRQWRPTALFCHNDWLALTASRALRSGGLRVPEDISILGVDNSDTFVQLCPEFTTLRYPMEEVAAACRAALLRRSCSLPCGSFQIIERATVRVL